MEVRGALRAALGHDGPVYIRLGKKGEPVVHNDVPPFRIGQGIWIRRTDGVGSACLLSTGNLLPTAVEAADQLQRRGIDTCLASMPTVKPLDGELLEEAFQANRLVITLEEHSVLGGFGGSVAEWRCEHPNGPGALLQLGTQDRFLHEAGEQEYARRCFGLTAEEIVNKIARKLSRDRS